MVGLGINTNQGTSWFWANFKTNDIFPLMFYTLEPQKKPEEFWVSGEPLTSLNLNGNFLLFEGEWKSTQNCKANQKTGVVRISVININTLRPPQVVVTVSVTRGELWVCLCPSAGCCRPRMWLRARKCVLFKVLAQTYEITNSVLFHRGGHKSAKCFPGRGALLTGFFQAGKSNLN